MPATDIAERIGWTRGITILKERVAELCPLYLEGDPYQRTHYEPGELAQWDIWFPTVGIDLGYGHKARPPVIEVTGVVESGYGKDLVELLPHLTRAQLRALGARPWDGPCSSWCGACWARSCGSPGSKLRQAPARWWL